MPSYAQTILLGNRSLFRANNVEDALVELRRRELGLNANWNDTTLNLGIYSPAPTTVLSAAAAATTIVNGIKVPFMRVSGSSTLIDTDNDPNYNHAGVPTGKMGVSSSDMAVPSLLTGGASQAARWQPRVGFWYTGQKFGIYIRTLANPLLLQVWVNGLPIASAPISNVVGIPERRHFEVDLGSIDRRLIEFSIDGQNAETNGITIEPGATLRRAPNRRKLCVLGDSIASGANGVGQGQVWPDLVAQRFAMTNWRLSIGSTGYSTLTGTSAFIDRVGDALAANPDVLIIEGGQNDGGITSTQAQTLATTLITALQAQLPTCIIMVLGCWNTSENVTQARRDIDDGLRAAALAASVPFKSMIDPFNLYPTSTNWQFSTAYAVGDRVRETTTMRNVLVCHTAHTSAGSGLPDMTKFYAQSLVTGTGKVGTTTGRGNADRWIQSDGVHATAEGHQGIDGFVSEWLLSTLFSIGAS